MSKPKPWIAIVIAGALICAVAALLAQRLLEPQSSGRGRGEARPAPVEVAAVETGAIENRRVFSGALEPAAQVIIAPKVAGRVVELAVELADTVTRGQVIAKLDSAEFVQAFHQARAEFAVAQANLREAESAAVIAQRGFERIQALRTRGVASEAQLDTASAENLAQQAALEVAKAEVTRAQAARQSARIRLDYTTIKADWRGDDDQRLVAERSVEEGNTVAANTPLVTLVDLDPVRAVLHVTERDYAKLQTGQEIALRTDAFPDRSWRGQVARVAPVFQEGSRQARVEVDVENPELLLKPGMFVQAEALLGRVEQATIVPTAALAERGGRDVVFVVTAGKPAKRGDGQPSAATATVRMVPVEIGIRTDTHAQITSEGVAGHVVTLGQQLLKDGSPIITPTVTPTGGAAQPASEDASAAPSNPGPGAGR